jgi:uncharacterized protein (DUF427 family)
MTEKRHYATVHMAGEHYVARVGDETLVETDRAMVLEEVNDGKEYPPVIYFPQDEIAPERLQPTDHHTRCPIKGEASYFTVKTDGAALENAAWTYPDPLPEARAVKGYVAFYPDKVTIERM